MKQTVIYLRTSTEEQDPANQLANCLEVVSRLNLRDYEVLQEKLSAWKDIERPIFNQISEAIRKGEIKNLVVWDFDRLFRNRQKTLEFIRNYSKLGLRVYSFRQTWIEQFNQMPEPWNEIMSELMLNIVSWMAEDESKKKSERVRAAVRKNNNGTFSYRGNLWGRKTLVSKRLTEEILTLHLEGKSIRRISELVYFYDESRNKKLISKSLVHKILSQNKEQELRNLECPKIDPFEDRA